MLRQTIISLKQFLVFRNQFIRYIISGVLSALMEFVSLLIQVEYFSINYLIANGISFIVTNIFNYWLSRNWVFIKGRYRRRIEILTFFVVVFVGLLINQLVMKVSVETFAIDYKIAKVMAITITVIWNFTSKKYIVFKG